MICDYEMNTAFQCPHLPYRTEFAQFLTSPIPADTAELASTVRNFDRPTALALAKCHWFPYIYGYVWLLPNIIMSSNINGHTAMLTRKITHICVSARTKRLTFRKDDTANLLHQSEITSIITAAHSSKNTFHCLIPGSSVIAQGCKGQVMGDMEKHLQEAPESMINSFTATYELLTAYDPCGRAQKHMT